MLTRRAVVPALVALVLAFGLGAAGGAWADQTFPDYVPTLGLRDTGSKLDRLTYNQALRIVQTRYYDRHLDYDKMSQGSVKGMVQALGDPYTNYLDPRQYRNQQNAFAGRHTGVIGIYVTFASGYPGISGLVPGSPAARAGLRTGDVIVAIDGRDTKGLSPEQTAALIRGPQGSWVVLDIRRDGADITFRVQREDFESPMVVSQKLEPTILYIRVYQFGTATTREFDQQLNAELPGATGVVLDLRDNPGGYIDAATAMISRFVSDGEAYELRDRSGRVDRHDVEPPHPAPAIPLRVLVNGGTASAAEIVSGSLQARRRAPLIGVKTFGKGSVQMDYPLADGGDLHLTVQHWFLPDGRSINGTGVMPDEVVTLPSPQAMYDPVQPALGHRDDTQLNRALEELRR